MVGALARASLFLPAEGDAAADAPVHLVDFLLERAVVADHTAGAEDRVLGTREAELHLPSGDGLLLEEEEVRRVLHGPGDALGELEALGRGVGGELLEVHDDRECDLGDLGDGLVDGVHDGTGGVTDIADSGFVLLGREAVGESCGGRGRAGVVAHGDSLRKVVRRTGGYDRYCFHHLVATKAKRQCCKHYSINTIICQYAYVYPFAFA